MKILIVEADPKLGRVWTDQFRRSGATVVLAVSQAAAIEALASSAFDAIVLDLTLPDGSALAVADFALYRRPDAKVIFVSDGSVFSDGSIFNLMSNASAFLQSNLPPEDLTAIVEYHAAAR